ncbi:uncharacterized protein KY384_008037 [Bacidia gigantensis]|uniref:uncharacterized protein n=1 Tax=Bacidia gigantensis TaxID=2732470 RepID=UPI001D059AC8|nr:uncharacterized protein KY384_008037 [Bacidia gigantensis]KAG8527293.1 hypothetical protein KY384_008037 [Bacidia gigantensis]
MSYYLPPISEIPESRHAAVGAWFLGPRAENFSYLENVFKYILEQQRDTRENLFPKDQAFITAEMKESPLYKAQIDQLQVNLFAITKELNRHAVPFWSARYNAHMSMENSMPAVIGYLTGLLHNQNNVATEASPFTTLLENEVGIDLCNMLGYDTNKDNVARAWGHITSDKKSTLHFLDNPFGATQPFEIDLSSGKKKLFMHCTTWELLNLKPSTVLGIPQQLSDQYGVSQTALAAAMKPYSIQTVGKDFLEKKFHVNNPAQFFVGTTKHYSWPKGAAIAGIGSGQIVDVPVDLRARMDPEKLREMLEKAIANEQPIYAVIAIIGSTEQGAVDPLAKILSLRTDFEKRGLSFVVHCDGVPKGQSSYVPTLALSPYTEEQLRAYKDADSITIDPHKSGYCPYPAGGLCYRDGRMRYLVTWTSPVVFHQGDEVESIGVYGVEGSKPGAAAVGAYLSHRVLGLHKNGYGTLLGEAVFSCARLYCHWAAMQTEPIPSSHGTKAKLIVRPLNMLPTEEQNDPPYVVENQRQFIRDHILYRDNAALEADKEAVRLLKRLGGDLMINAFACNFEIDGKINTDVTEANYLNTQIFQQLSVSDIRKDISNVPLLLTSTSLAQSQYKDCLTHFKNRLGLEGEQDLYILINVTMSPWPTTGDFLGELADKFKDVAQQQMLATVERDVQYPDHHGFVIQGLDHICGVHLPMFNMENHRHQLIISCDFPKDIMDEYRRRKTANPSQFFTFGNKNPAELLKFIKDGASFEATIQEGLPSDNKPISESFTVSNVKILLQRSMHSKDLDTLYPDNMIFYAYGRGSELHIDHLLNVSPNIQLNSERIKVLESSAFSPPLKDVINEQGVWLRLTSVHESAVQPLIMKPTDPHTSFAHPGLDFKPGAKFAFEAFDPATALLNNNSPSNPTIRGVLELGPSVFADTVMLNADGGGADHDHASAATVMDAPANSWALAAEYPNAAASEELRNQYQSTVLRGFRDSWAMAKREEAEKVLERYEGKKGEESEGKGEGEAPDWLKRCVRDGERAEERKGPELVQLYHTGLR